MYRVITRTTPSTSLSTQNNTSVRRDSNYSNASKDCIIQSNSITSSKIWFLPSSQKSFWPSSLQSSRLHSTCWFPNSSDSSCISWGKNICRKSSMVTSSMFLSLSSFWGFSFRRIQKDCFMSWRLKWKALLLENWYRNRLEWPRNAETVFLILS